MVDADTKEKEINKKGMSRLTIGGGEAIRPQIIEALRWLVRS